MKVIFSRETRDDLEKIKSYIATDSPLRAISFVDELIDAAAQVAEIPEAFPLIPRYEHKGIRRKPYGNYLIFYQIEPTCIGIVHILHSAQDYAKLLFPDD